MAAWMIYVIVLSTALSIAALIAEQAAWQRRGSRRWLWMSAMIVSLLLPIAVSSVSIRLPGSFGPAAAQKPLVLRDATSMHLPAAVTDLLYADEPAAAPRLDTRLAYGWGAASMVVVATLMLGAFLLRRRRSNWTSIVIGRTPVLMAQDVGPAVVGWLRPCIVVPAWLVQAPAKHRELVLAHEQAHLDAHDPLLLAAALWLLALMPWNLPLWWQLHRLRRAIEVDCDARVLRSGCKLTAYGEALIEAGQHRSTRIGAMTAMSEPPSFLEQRIKIMLRKPTKWAPAWVLSLACLSTGMVAVAAQVSPPETAGTITPQPVTVPVSTLQNYVGAYQFGPFSVMTVTLQGSQLVTQLSGQPNVEIYPSSQTEFFAKIVQVTVTFARDAQGQMTFTLHQNGRDMTAPRIDSTAARQINDLLATRVKNQQPFPGSEAALQRLLSDRDAVTGVSPALAAAMKVQRPAMQSYLTKLGPVVSHEFAGVMNNGWDKYVVRHQHGTEEVSLVLDSNGIIIGALRHP